MIVDDSKQLFTNFRLISIKKMFFTRDLSLYLLNFLFRLYPSVFDRDIRPAITGDFLRLSINKDVLLFGGPVFIDFHFAFPHQPIRSSARTPPLHRISMKDGGVRSDFLLGKNNYG